MKNNNPPYQAHHGALNYAELDKLGIHPEDVLDFSSNINPYGPSPSVRTAIQAADVRTYPDRDSVELKRSIAAIYNIPIDNILIGNGASELIWLLCFAFIQPGEPVLVFMPTFGEYARCASLMGAMIESIEAPPENHFIWPLDKIEKTIELINPRLIFICNPNNPTGTGIDYDELLALVKDHPNTKFIIDEAYIEFTTRIKSLIGNELKNLIVLRSLTKYYALAGLRLGFIYGDPEIIQKTTNVRPSWNINAAAQAAGVAAIKSHDELMNSLSLLAESEQYLIENLNQNGYATHQSNTHFFLTKVGSGAKFRYRLLTEHRIQVRDCASFGLPEYVRISTQLPQDNRRLIDAIRSIT